MTRNGRSASRLWGVHPPFLAHGRRRRLGRSCTAAGRGSRRAAQQMGSWVAPRDSPHVAPSSLGTPGAALCAPPGALAHLASRFLTTVPRLDCPAWPNRCGQPGRGPGRLHTPESSRRDGISPGHLAPPSAASVWKWARPTAPGTEAAVHRDPGATVRAARRLARKTPIAYNLTGSQPARRPRVGAHVDA
jgi:hypothetical protein